MLILNWSRTTVAISFDTTDRRLRSLHAGIWLKPALLFTLRRPFSVLRIVHARALTSLFVRLKRFPKDRVLHRTIPWPLRCGRCSITRIWRWLEGVLEHLHKVAWEETNSPRVPSQPPHPPRSISSVQSFNQVSFYKSKIFLRFTSPRIRGSTPTGECWHLRCSTHPNLFEPQRV